MEFGHELDIMPLNIIFLTVFPDMVFSLEGQCCMFASEYAPLGKRQFQSYFPYVLTYSTLVICRCTGHDPINQPFETPPGQFVNEKAMMVSGMIPIIFEVDGEPLRVIWRNKDVNSPLAFRVFRYAQEVSLVLHKSLKKLVIS